MAWAKEAEHARKKRQSSRDAGLCLNCHRRSRILQRTQCEHCTMLSIIQGAFKYDRRREMPNASAMRGSCYVEQYAPDKRREVSRAIMAKFNGRCFYTGLPIELGATASLDHKLPVSKAGVYGSARVFSVENMEWCHRAFNNLKGNMTAEEFRAWLRLELLPVLQAQYA
jgi:hypothetical protein